MIIKANGKRLRDNERTKKLRDALDRGFVDVMVEMQIKHRTAMEHMSEAERRAYMKANHMYPGPDYDPEYYNDPEAWWKRYEEANPIP